MYVFKNNEFITIGLNMMQNVELLVIFSLIDTKLDFMKFHPYIALNKQKPYSYHHYSKLSIVSMDFIKAIEQSYLISEFEFNFPYRTRNLWIFAQAR